MKTNLLLMGMLSALVLASRGQVATPPSASNLGDAPSEASAPFISERGQHQVILAPNINTTNAVGLQMSDGIGQRMKERES